jgi:hypothetical protein
MEDGIERVDTDEINNSKIENNNKNDKNITITNFYKKATYPMISLLTVLIKLASIISFFLFSIFLSNEAIIMFIVVLIGLCDFWMTKNISGRFLAGLRWYNLLKSETNTEIWVFEGKKENDSNMINRSIFWYSLYINDIIWIVLFIWEFIRLRFDWSFICLILIIFSFTNTYGFYKSSKIQQKGTKFLIKKYIVEPNMKK